MGKFDKGGKSFGGKPSFGGSRGGKPSFGGKSFGGGDRGGRPSFGGRDGGRREERSTESFKAVCDSCHKSCEVPFRPTSGKPVYCNDCFAKNRDFDNRPSFGNRDGQRDTYRNDAKRDQKPFTKRNDQPAPAQNIEHEILKQEVKALHVKLDTLMRDFNSVLGSVKGVAKAEAPILTKEIKSTAKKVEKVVKTKALAAKKEIKKDIKVAKKAATKVVKKVAKKLKK
jgi:CxxC-x17-CxxC domain-containing protein